MQMYFSFNIHVKLTTIRYAVEFNRGNYIVIRIR